MKNIYIIVGIIVCAVLLAVVFMGDRSSTNTPSTDTPAPIQDEDTAVNVAVPEYGLSFSYDEDGYTYVRQDDQQRGDLVYAGSIFDAEEYEAFLRNATAGEAPVSLHIAVYRNPMNLSPVEWIQATKESNFSLSPDGSYDAKTLGAIEYLHYTWDGLYRADAYVTSQEGYIYVLSNMWMDNASPMRTAMEEVIASVTITDPTVPASVAHGDIKVTTPQPGASVSSPITITGEARGYWFFEASFPIVIVDWDGIILAEGYATAEGDWMTEEFVPFTAQIEYNEPSVPDFNTRGAIILKKDNPSGLPENDDAIEIPITFR